MGQQNQTHLGDRRQYAPVLVAGMALALLLALAAPARAAAQDTPPTGSQPSVVSDRVGPGTYVFGCPNPGCRAVGSTYGIARINAYCFGHYGWLNGDDTWIYADIDDRPNGGRIWYRYWLSKSQTGPIPGLPRC